MAAGIGRPLEKIAGFASAYMNGYTRLYSIFVGELAKPAIF